jgi:hypothetical protein
MFLGYRCGNRILPHFTARDSSLLKENKLESIFQKTFNAGRYRFSLRLVGESSAPSHTFLSKTLLYTGGPRKIKDSLPRLDQLLLMPVPVALDSADDGLRRANETADLNGACDYVTLRKPGPLTGSSAVFLAMTFPEEKKKRIRGCFKTTPQPAPCISTLLASSPASPSWPLETLSRAGVAPRS